LVLTLQDDAVQLKENIVSPGYGPACEATVEAQCNSIPLDNVDVSFEPVTFRSIVPLYQDAIT
jgi:hypothetical protein